MQLFSALSKLLGLSILFLFHIENCVVRGEEIALWDEGVPYPLSPESLSKHKTYDDTRGRRYYTHVPTLIKTESSKKGSNNWAKLVFLVIPGGGYEYVSNGREGVTTRDYLNSFGSTVYILNYRCKPYHHPVPLEDAVRAVRIVKKAHSDKKVVVMGFSAGGHLAASLAVFCDAVDDNNWSEYLSLDTYKLQPRQPNLELDSISCRPDFNVFVYPVISMKNSLTHAGSKLQLIGAKSDFVGAGDEVAYNDLVKLLSMDRSYESIYKKKGNKTKMGSVLLVHSNDDYAVPVENSVLMHRALKSAKVDVEMVIYNTGGHGYGIHAKKDAPPWNIVLESWVERRKA